MHPIESNCLRGTTPASTVVSIFFVLFCCIFGCVGKSGIVMAFAAKPTIPVTAACSSNSAATCVIYLDGAGVQHEVALFDGKFDLVDVALMGTFQVSGSPHQFAYMYGSAHDAKFKGNAWVSVIDLTSAKSIAWVVSPSGYRVGGTYFSYIRDPEGRKYPFIAPALHYLKEGVSTPSGSYLAPAWNFLCLFDPAFIAHPDPACATGFKHYNTSFTTPEGISDVKASGFRHGGGWVEDVDGDGWDDINLPFMRYVLTISGRTGRQIALAHFDVAAHSEPGILPYFHSGKFDGGYAAFVDPTTGTHDVLFTDGITVGLFNDLYCGVSRYVAVAQWHPGPSLQLEWSDYLSFTKTIFKKPFNSLNNYYRLGNDLDRCPHYFGTSFEWLNGKPLVIFSLFRKDDPAPVCQAELLAEQKSHFLGKDENAANAAYEFRCAPQQILAAKGHWSIHILDALTGADLRDYPNAYVWGEAMDVLPGAPQTLLVQQLRSNGGDVVYDRTGDAADSLTLVRLTNGPALTVVATLSGPLPVPVVNNGGYNGAGPALPPGIGSSKGGISHLILHDIDGDGLNDIQLKGGRWIGYSAKTEGLVIKTRPASPSP